MSKRKNFDTMAYFAFLTVIAFGISTAYQYIKNLYDETRIFEKVMIIASFAFIIYFAYKKIKKDNYYYQKEIKEKYKEVAHINHVAPHNGHIIKRIQEMDPIAVEHLVADIMRKRGFIKVSVTPAGNDGGKDVTAIDPVTGELIYCEVKRYKDSNTVGRERIQKLHSACIDGHARGLFVTTSRFTDNAIKYAEKHNIELIDGRELSRWITSCSLQKRIG